MQLIRLETPDLWLPLILHQFHTGRNNKTFATLHGQSITRGLEELAERYDLNSVFGIAPRDYSINR